MAAEPDRWLRRRAPVLAGGRVHNPAAREELARQELHQWIVIVQIVTVTAASRGDAASLAHALQAYIEGSVEFIDKHREQMKALADIFMTGGFSGSRRPRFGENRPRPAGTGRTAEPGPGHTGMSGPAGPSREESW